MYKLVSLIRKISLVLFFMGILTTHSLSQEHKQAIIISQKVGILIDSAENIQFNLFPEYSDDFFHAAQCFKNPDGSLEVCVYLVTGEKETIPLSREEYRLLRKKINYPGPLPLTEPKDYVEKIAPEYYPPYTSEAYQLERSHSMFVQLTERQQKGDSLNSSESNWLEQFNTYLDEYYTRMPEAEQEKFLGSMQPKEKQDELETPDEQLTIREEETVAKERDQSAYIKHALYSGYYGLYYGQSLNYIFSIEGGPAVGIPLITAGGSVLWAALSKHNISDNALLLCGHGRLMGWVYGFSTSALIFGDKATDSDISKISLSLGVASSIGLGRLGLHLAQRNDWTEGRVALYRHYGKLIPATGAAIAFSTGEENINLFGATILASGAGGYYLAHKIANITNYTRGNIIAMKGFTGLNIMLGIGIAADYAIETEDDRRSLILIPTAGALAGTAITHFWLQGAYLSNTQGRRIVYATIGGSLIGTGLIAFFEPDRITPFYIAGYLSGLACYGSLLNHYKKYGDTADRNESKSNSTFSFDLMPQNIFINQMLYQNGTQITNPEYVMLPLFAFSKTF